MTVKRRLIPKLLLKTVETHDRPALVTTVRFEGIMAIGDAVAQAKIYEAQAADELLFLDLDACRERRPPNVGVVKTAAEQLFIPFTVGGGVQSLQDFETCLTHGADKVALNTSAVECPGLIADAAEHFGAQCVVLGIDVSAKGGTSRVWTRAGTIETDLDPLEWARQAEELGAGEILLTSIDRDGTRAGLDIAITRRIADAVTIPVIASGGCGLASHFTEGFLEGGASAVAAGTYFCFRDENPMQLRSRIRNSGIPIRLHT